MLEGYPIPSNSPNPLTPSCDSILGFLGISGGLEGKEGLEAVVNYLIDLFARCGYILDKQMNAVELKHQQEGGYRESLLKKRLEYKKSLRT